MKRIKRPLQSLMGSPKSHVPCRDLSHSCRRWADEVRVVEVGPRDGLQNEKTSIPLKTKITLIERLAETGVRDMEAGSFVPAKWVPQMANSKEVLDHLLSSPPPSTRPIAYNFLVPNIKGFENFLKPQMQSYSGTQASDHEASSFQTIEDTDDTASITSSADLNTMPSSSPSSAESCNANKSKFKASTMEISLFTAATEAFSKANTNCTIAESLQRCEPIVLAAKAKEIRVRGYVSVALGCPYEGPDVSPSKVAEITRTLLAMGVDEVSVADTTGMGTAPKTQALLKAIQEAGISASDLALHFHDTYGQALVNVVVGLEHGIRKFDSSVGGLGGCPYSKGATGNVATEDLLHCLHSLGLQTGISLEKVAAIGSWISNELGRPNESRAGKAVLARLSQE